MTKSLALLFLATSLARAAENNWPQWRGPLANGTAPGANPPVKWDETTNVRWKTPIPGRGVSTPVVWGDLVFVTSAIPTAKPAPASDKEMPDFMRKGARLPANVFQFVVFAVTRQDGRIRWQTTVLEEAPQAGTHSDGSWASASPITDGEHVWAFFGSQGLYCLDMAGQVKWQQRFGQMKMRASFGEGTTPALHGDTLVLAFDHEEKSFLVALDKRTGKEKWRQNRDEVSSWATPLVVEHNGTRQVVTSGSKKVRANDLATGTLLWETPGMTLNAIPSPVRFEDTVIALSGFRGAAGLAIRLDQARGHLSTNTAAIAWKLSKGTPYVPSPLLAGEQLYYFKINEALLTCANARTGAPHYTQQLDGIKRIYASPVSAAGRVYITGTEGTTHVLKTGPAFELLSSNKLDDKFTASAALAGADLFLRGEKSLYCIGAPR